MIPDPVYLDYAATSAIRPPEVVDAVAAYLRDIGATPGRSGHARALAAGRVALRCRIALARLFGIEGDPGRVAFQFNATHALNTALGGVLRPGDRLVRTVFDHNSVRRPAATLAASGVEVSVLPGDADGGIDLATARELLHGGGRPARMLALPHISNVLGQRLPVRDLAGLAHEVGAVVLLDAAQSAGHVPLRVDDLGVDLLAFTGHKGLLGPQGTGGLWVREGLAVEPGMRGGTGGDSLPAMMPDSYPDHLEAGTQNGPGIAGLLAGVEWILARGVDTLHAKERDLKARLFAALGAREAVRVLSPPDPSGAGIVTFVSRTMPASSLAAALDRDHGIQTRAGLHCAPESHEVIGTVSGGAVRMSLGWASSESDVDRAVTAVEDIHNLEIRSRTHR